MDDFVRRGIDSPESHTDGVTMHYIRSGWCLPSEENCSAFASFPCDPTARVRASKQVLCYIRVTDSREAVPRHSS